MGGLLDALNEGWEPQFTEDEWRYCPWFYIYSKEEWNVMSEEDIIRDIGWSVHYANANGSLVYAYASFASSYSNSDRGSRLVFKNKELARYAGKQFVDIWADYVLIRK